MNPYIDEVHFHRWRNGAHGPWYDHTYTVCIGSGQFAHCDGCGAMIFVGSIDGDDDLFAVWIKPVHLKRQRISLDAVSISTDGERTSDESV